MIKKQKIPNEPVSDFELSESDIVSDFGFCFQIV